MQGTLDFFYQAVREQPEPVPHHAHQCFEFVYYLKGSGRSDIGGREHAFGANQFALIYPHTVHDERHAEATDVVFFGFDYSSDAVLPDEGIYRDDGDLSLLSVIRRMLFEMERQSPYYKQMMDVLVTETVIRLARRASPDHSAATADKVGLAQAFMDEYFSQRIDFAALARQAGYSHDRFRHLFKEQTGLPPTGYILRRRIQLAQRLLTGSDKPVAAIAQDCGFSNEAQFCSMFKRETGMTPGQYRRG